MSRKIRMNDYEYWTPRLGNPLPNSEEEIIFVNVNDPAKVKVGKCQAGQYATGLSNQALQKCFDKSEPEKYEVFEETKTSVFES